MLWLIGLSNTRKQQPDLWVSLLWRLKNIVWKVDWWNIEIMSMILEFSCSPKRLICIFKSVMFFFFFSFPSSSLLKSVLRFYLDGFYVKVPWHVSFKLCLYFMLEPGCQIYRGVTYNGFYAREVFWNWAHFMNALSLRNFLHSLLIITLSCMWYQHFLSTFAHWRTCPEHQLTT